MQTFRAPAISALTLLCLLSACRPPVPDVSGTWTGRATLSNNHKGTTSATVTLALTQDGQVLHGRAELAMEGAQHPVVVALGNASVSSSGQVLLEGNATEDFGMVRLNFNGAADSNKLPGKTVITAEIPFLGSEVDSGPITLTRAK